MKTSSSKSHYCLVLLIAVFIVCKTKSETTRQESFRNGSRNTPEIKEYVNHLNHPPAKFHVDFQLTDPKCDHSSSCDQHSSHDQNISNDQHTSHDQNTSHDQYTSHDQHMPRILSTIPTKIIIFLKKLQKESKEIQSGRDNNQFQSQQSVSPSTHRSVQQNVLSGNHDTYDEDRENLSTVYKSRSESDDIQQNISQVKMVKKWGSLATVKFRRWWLGKSPAEEQVFSQLATCSGTGYFEKNKEIICARCYCFDIIGCDRFKLIDLHLN
ncbi:hypothetical protein Btru_067019 [Bulinus truncatus]|nr:hypothetical protein Btru_067019 [Bulinus truncatus]